MELTKLFLLLASVASLLFSCSSLDKASRKRKDEAFQKWYGHKRQGLISTSQSRELLFQARNDAYLDSFPTWHGFNFGYKDRFTQLTLKSRESFYCGEYRQKMDTIFLTYYEDAHPKEMATFLLVDTTRKVLLYPFVGAQKQIPLDVRYSVFDVR